jgi:hypothetical protein
MIVILAWKLASTRLVSYGSCTNWLGRDFCNTNGLSDEAWAGAAFYDGVRTTRTLNFEAGAFMAFWRASADAL